MEMETTRIKGIDSTERVTRAKLGKGVSLVVREKIYTHGNQTAATDFLADLDGEDSSADLVSRSVAAENSRRKFTAVINGNARCTGHSESDSIVMNGGSVTALPALTANSVEASRIHEAAIGKIAGEQITKLMTLGLTEEEAKTADYQQLPVLMTPAGLYSRK